MRKPIHVFYSELSRRFYASDAYRVEGNGVVVITGRKYDVTGDIVAAIVNHRLRFDPPTLEAPDA